MNKLGLLTMAARYAPRILQLQRRTWIMLGVGLLVMVILFIWAAIALIGWLLSVVLGLGATAPEAARGAIASVEQQIGQVLPSAREQIAAVIPGLQVMPQTQRDVSGTDPAPVARFPGFARTTWFREGRRITVQYDGRADYAAVLSHYVQGFAALGYTQAVQSATRDSETHVWTKGAEHFLVNITSKPKGVVSVRIETHVKPN